MITFIAILVALMAGAALAAVLLRRRPPGADPVWSELASMRAEMLGVAQRVSSDSSEVARRLEGIDQRMTVTQTASVELAKDIFERLGDVRSATTSVAEQAREFSSLQDLLRAPNARGGLGEALLEELLRQLLPPHAYSMQHRFSSGSTVDAVVKVGGRIVCIDSKFPLANFRRMCDAPNDLERAEAERTFVADVHKHIRDISSRYVVPDEGTFDFAVMYVPAEGVYGELLRLTDRRRPLFESAIEARVVPMSPLTMCGYLQTILFGLKCLSIEKSAEAILDFCGRLQQDFERFETEYEVLGKHLGNARAKYEEGARRLDRFRDKLDQTVDLADEGREDRPATLEVVGDDESHAAIPAR